MAIATEEAVYVVGETVRVEGQVSSPAYSNSLVLINVVSPDQEIFRSGKFEVSEDGAFSWAFAPSSQVGEWTVYAIFTDEEAETTFRLLGADVFDKVVVQEPRLVDIEGRILAQGTTGAGIRITADLSNDEQEEQAFVYIVQVTGEDGAVAGVTLALGSLQPGQSASPAVMWSPQEPGAYVAEIFVWSSLGDPEPLAEKQVFEFEVA